MYIVTHTPAVTAVTTLPYCVQVHLYPYTGCYSSNYTVWLCTGTSLPIHQLSQQQLHCLAVYMYTFTHTPVVTAVTTLSDCVHYTFTYTPVVTAVTTLSDCVHVHLYPYTSSHDTNYAVKLCTIHIYTYTGCHGSNRIVRLCIIHIYPYTGCHSSNSSGTDFPLNTEHLPSC